MQIICQLKVGRDSEILLFNLFVCQQKYTIVFVNQTCEHQISCPRQVSKILDM